jgi:type IV fimbrial biogenesis protein FimT
MDTKHDDRTARAGERGVTLIETMIVIAVTVIIAAAAAPSLTRLIDARRLDAAANELAGDIQFVRTEAVARNRPVRLSLHGGAAPSCWIVHTGAAAQCSCAAQGPAICIGGAVQIKTVNLPATDRVGLASNVASMLFDPLHGTATPTGTLRVTDANGSEVRHIVNVMGRARSCSPNGVIGWRAC